jgi:hypothetical protein
MALYTVSDIIRQAGLGRRAPLRAAFDGAAKLKGAASQPPAPAGPRRAQPASLDRRAMRVCETSSRAGRRHHGGRGKSAPTTAASCLAPQSATFRGSADVTHRPGRDRRATTLEPPTWRSVSKAHRRHADPHRRYSSNWSFHGARAPWWRGSSISAWTRAGCPRPATASSTPGLERHRGGRASNRRVTSWSSVRLASSGPRLRRDD